MPTAHVLRQQVLDQLYQILKDPLLYGNSILLNIVNAPKDGLVSLKLIYSLTSQLKPYPLEYVEYCVPRDLDQRFRWSSDFTRVGLKENARFYETNAFGFIEEDLDNADTSRPQHAVQPVIYDNGKFYIDDEHNRSQGPSNVRFYEYDKLDIQPLGRKSPLIIRQVLCYNCDKHGHNFRDCPLPKNYSKINSHSDRLFTHVDTDAMKAGRLSQPLKEALGMTLEHDEPPYYSRMRYYGYPPGYMAYRDNATSTETPMLKVYDGDCVIHTRDGGSQDKSQTAPAMYSVDYPGLYAETEHHAPEAADPSTLHTSDQTQSLLQQQWDEYYYNQYQQYYQQMYYASEPPPPNMESSLQTAPPVIDTLNPLLGSNRQADHDHDSDDMDISSGDEG